MNTLVAGTDIALKLKDNEVKRHWYYNWLGRCKRLRTANLTPLEMSRAEWATAANIKQHYDMVAELLVETGIAVPKEGFDPTKPNDERLCILKPERLFSMDETRLTNDTTEKNKAKRNRSIVSSAGSREVLANKGGGEALVVAQPMGWIYLASSFLPRTSSTAKTSNRPSNHAVAAQTPALRGSCSLADFGATKREAPPLM